MGEPETVSAAEALLARTSQGLFLSSSELETVREEMWQLREKIERAEEARRLAEGALTDANDDRAQWRQCLFEVLRLGELVTEDVALVAIDKTAAGEWVAYHQEYPEEGSISLAGIVGQPSISSAPALPAVVPPIIAEVGSAPGEALNDSESDAGPVVGPNGAPDTPAAGGMPAAPAGAQEHQDREAGAGRLAGDAPGAVTTTAPAAAKKLSWGHNGNGSAWHLFAADVRPFHGEDDEILQKADCGEEVSGSILWADKPVADNACLDCTAAAGIEATLPCDDFGATCPNPGVPDPETGGNFCEAVHLKLALGFRREAAAAAHPELAARRPRSPGKKMRALAAGVKR